MRCDACGASNPPKAAWCNQCFARIASLPAAGVDDRGGQGLVAGEPAILGPIAGGPTAVEPAAHTGEAASGERDGSGEDTEDLATEGFRRRAGLLEWECPRCGAYTTIERTECEGCGTAMRERFAGSEEEVAGPPGALVYALDAVAPGLGHVLIGRPGPGLARLLLYLVWLGGGLSLLTDGSAAAAAMAAPLLLGALLILAGSLAELARLPREPDLLDSRVLLWLMIGVLGLAALAGVAVAGSMSAGPVASSSAAAGMLVGRRHGPAGPGEEGAEMSDIVRESVEVSADQPAIMRVITDVESYPDWQEEILSAEVLEHGEDGRPLRARFRVDAKLFTTTYTLRYAYADGEMSWDLESGDQLEILRGRYVLVEHDGGMEVTYELEVRPKMRIPGIMRRQATRRIVDAALTNMKRRVESQA